MTNFIFKSPQAATFKKISNNIEMLLAEQRHQRQDLAALLYLVKQLGVDKGLQTQVDEFYEKPHVPDPADLD